MLINIKLILKNKEETKLEKHNKIKYLENNE
jgi:hypothetical protein